MFASKEAQYKEKKCDDTSTVCTDTEKAYMEMVKKKNLKIISTYCLHPLPKQKYMSYKILREKAH